MLNTATAKTADIRNFLEKLNAILNKLISLIKNNIKAKK